jgi:hypothetical protein
MSEEKIQMAFKCINIFQPTALESKPKLVFLCLKINHLATLIPVLILEVIGGVS